MTNTYSPNPVLVEITRRRGVESRHRGAISVFSFDGTMTYQAGDVDRPVFPRSAYKILQALPLIETGAADAYGLANHQLALACASHNSEPGHVDAVTDWLESIDCTPGHLACGAHQPYHL